MTVTLPLQWGRTGGGGNRGREGEEKKKERSRKRQSGKVSVKTVEPFCHREADESRF